MFNEDAIMDKVRSAYRSQMTKEIVTCQGHGKSYVDVKALNRALKRVTNDQTCELEMEDWIELIYDLAPDVYDDIDFGILAA